MTGARTTPLRAYLWRLIALCMLPLLLLSGWLAVQSVRTTRAEIDAEALAKVKSIVAAVDQDLNARIGALSVMAGSPQLGDASRQNDLYQQGLAYRQTFGSDVVLADLQGRMLFNTRVPLGTALPPLPRPTSNAAVPKALASGKPAVGDSFVGPIAKQPLVAIAVPVLRSGAPEFVLLTTLETRRFDDLLARSSMPTGWSVSLVDGKQTKLARFPAAHMMASPEPNPTASATVDVTEAGRFVGESGVSPWSVQLEIPRQYYRAPWLAAAQALALIVGAATLVGLLAGSWASRRLARSVATLAHGSASSPAEHAQEISEVLAVRQQLEQSALQREAAVLAMHDSEITFKSMFDGMADAMVFADPERRIRMVNPAFTAMFGRQASELVGGTTEILYADPTEYGRMGRERYNGQAENARGTYAMLYRHRDGQVFWAESNGVRIVGQDGRIVGLLGVHRDISERVRAETAYRELHERFAQIFRTSPLGICIDLIADASFVDVNPAFEALLGYDRDELLGRSSADLQLWVDPQAQQAVAQALRTGDSLSHLETQMRHKSGRVIDVAYAGCRVDIGGEPHLMGMISDIGPQKDARRKLERHQEQLEAEVAQRTAELQAANLALTQRAEVISDLYDHAPCGYLSVAADRTVIQVNNTCLRMLGYDRTEFLGQPISQFMTPDSRVLHEQRLPLFMSNAQVRDLEYEFVCRDGSQLPVLVSADVLRDASGTLLSTRATLVDNSERRSRELQIAEMQAELARRADDAETANRAKSAFLANMSHEIRTPMNAILGLTHLLARDTHDTMQRERLAKVADAGHHLLQVINDILDLSKIEAGKMKLDDTEFSLDGLLSRAFEMVSGQAREKGLELVLDTDHLPDRLRGDATRLSQALINLLANAVKFTQQGWVRVRGRLLAEAGSRIHVRFEVQDTGEGIAPERQSALFNAFEQAETSSTRSHGGTGLGLALTRHLARMMGGEIGVESAPGAGSTFWFTVWVGRASEAGEHAAPITLHGLRALLVDDLEEARTALGDALRLLGLTVDSLDGGTAALRHVPAELAAGRAYGVMLIDWRMAPLDGVETLRRLRQMLGADMPPAILVTAFDEPAIWQQARLVACSAVLVKPVTASALHDALVRALRGQLTITPALPALPGQGEELLRREHAGQRVLLAEDNLVNQEVAQALLRIAGLIVETASDGERAVQMALSRHYDLILMDQQMPGMDGITATRAIREQAGRGIPIVAMTANAFSEDRQACLAAGMNDHVAKPVNPEQLYATLLRWLPLRDLAADKVATGLGPLANGERAGLSERLASVPGLDVEAALSHVGGREDTLGRVLLRFVQAHREGAPGFLSTKQTEDLGRWRALVHSLHGACATIGAQQLDRQLMDLDQALIAAEHSGAPLPLQSLERQGRQLHEDLFVFVGVLKAALDA